MFQFFLTAAFSYLLGSIPFGYVLLRIFRGQDVRQTGSGNIGATNVARSSPALGILTLLLDALKGAAAVAVTRALFPDPMMLAAVAALFAILGHIFPVWLRFRGGKGVATGLGSFLMLAPKIVLNICRHGVRFSICFLGFDCYGRTFPAARLASKSLRKYTYGTCLHGSRFCSYHRQTSR